MIENVTIIGTGLIGASLGLALRAIGFPGNIYGWDASPAALAAAMRSGALTHALSEPPTAASLAPGVIVLAGPVFTILDWMNRLRTLPGTGTLITDVGSTKAIIVEHARSLFTAQDRARFLPGHPMAGKERGGADFAEADLFRGRRWLFTPLFHLLSPIEQEWIAWIERIGASVTFLEADRHDTVCAWVSHLPQLLSTALASLLEEEFAGDPDIAAIGGRALEETTRLGTSPFSMWRDIAHTNAEPIAASLLALEQKLTHLRENLKSPALRDEFTQANAFRRRRDH